MAKRKSNTQKADLFRSGEEDVDAESGEDRRCTPELLLGFVRKCQAIDGRMPTLRECKVELGGILGPLIDFWELKRRGLL